MAIPRIFGSSVSKASMVVAEKETIYYLNSDTRNGDDQFSIAKISCRSGKLEEIKLVTASGIGKGYNASLRSASKIGNKLIVPYVDVKRGLIKTDFDVSLQAFNW